MKDARLIPARLVRVGDVLVLGGVRQTVREAAYRESTVWVRTSAGVQYTFQKGDLVKRIP